MSRSKKTGSTQKVGSGNRHHSGKSKNTPTRKGAEVRDAGEVTVGIAYRPVTPRVVGAANVARVKTTLGICRTPGCPQIEGHEGNCLEVTP